MVEADPNIEFKKLSTSLSKRIETIQEQLRPRFGKVFLSCEFEHQEVTYKLEWLPLEGGYSFVVAGHPHDPNAWEALTHSSVGIKISAISAIPHMIELFASVRRNDNEKLQKAHKIADEIENMLSQLEDE